MKYYINKNGIIYQTNLPYKGDREATKEEIELALNPIKTDEEIARIRSELYRQITDPMLGEVIRGDLSIKDYINAISKIRFENKKSNEQDKTFDDFYKEALEAYKNATAEVQ